MKRWIDHPGCTEPVWLHRWLAFQIGEWLYGLSGRLKHRAIHMPRWASRLTDVVTDVRVQRLLNISNEDAIAEGLERLSPVAYGIRGIPTIWHAAPAEAYLRLWDHINGADSWRANPWIVALTFTVEKRNIDQVPT